MPLELGSRVEATLVLILSIRLPGTASPTTYEAILSIGLQVFDMDPCNMIVKLTVIVELLSTNHAPIYNPLTVVSSTIFFYDGAGKFRSG